MGSGKTINIAEALRGAGAVSDLDTAGREKIEYIDIDLIDDDPTNFYELSDLEELSTNIELVGLQQPIRVRENPDDTSRVIICSGHRRRAAMRMLVTEGKERFRAVPCIRELVEGSKALQELRLIYANSDTRKMTPAEQSKQAERVEILLYQLKEEGIEFPGRMRDHVAAACKVSKTKLARLKVIRDGLIPAFIQQFDDDSLSEQGAYAVARFPIEFQERIAKAVSKLPSGFRLEEMLKYYQMGWRWEPTCTCPDGTACKHGDAFLRHDMECSDWEKCGGNVCCMTCDRATASYGVCDRACSKAKAARSESRAEAEVQKKKQENRHQKKLKREMQASAQRLLAAAEAAGLSDQTKISPSAYRDPVTVAELRSISKGIFEDKYYYGNDLDIARSDNLQEVSKVLQCSADYLLGFTDELGRPGKPTALNVDEGPVVPPDDDMDAVEGVAAPAITEPTIQDWQTGTPTVPGYYFVLTGPLHSGGKLYYWAGDHWEHPCAVMPMNINGTAWVLAPPIPEALSWERSGTSAGEET